MRSMFHRLFGCVVLPAFLGVAGAGPPAAADDKAFDLRRGDHISIIGNRLAEGMQHDGWLETLAHQRFPRHELTFRNLGFAGDEVAFRPRSEGFGTPDENLAALKTDVVFAFFGFNEAFGGASGLGAFRAQLDAFIKHTRGEKYNGRSPPRLVLFSPIAHENRRDPNLPDGREGNARLALFTGAMAEVARANAVGFVDLFHPTTALFASSSRPLTTNGIHLTEEGNRQLARIIDSALFGAPPAGSGQPPQSSIEKLRAAVLDKSRTWFHRHRTTDGYNIYGGRSYVKYVDGQNNRVVMQREMEVLDAMTAARDRRIWAVAQGRDLKVDDGGTPPFIPVKSNYPGAGPGGAHVFLGGEAAIARMTVAPGMKVNLFASEERFPELAKPVQMAFDARGRLWVAAWPSYPHWKPKEPMDDKLLIFEDTDGDGRADRCKVFAGGLNNPTGFELWNGGVLLAQAPDLVFLEDTDGDDRADRRTPILHGLSSADTHHTANTFVLDPGGALYFNEGWYGRTAIETPWGPPVRMAEAAIMRFEPRTWKAEVYLPYDCANPHGHVFDRWGQDIWTDGTMCETFFAASQTGRMEYPKQHRSAPRMFKPRTRPVGGIEILSSRHFPDENQGNLLLANVIGFRGILQYKVSDQGAGMAGTEVEPIVRSSDPSFRPIDIEMAPDGSVYFLDWQNPLIGHLQHAIRDPSRDHAHGRIYRVTYPSRPLLAPSPIAGAPVDRLLDLLTEPEDRVRYRARTELGARKTDEVIAATRRWMGRRDRPGSDREHDRLEALWVHERHNVVDQDLLRRTLRSPDFRARAAATRVLRHWRDRVPDVRELLRVQAGDPHPRVRLEAVVAATSLAHAGAVEIALECLKHERDPHLDYALEDAVATLAPAWKKALREGTLRVSEAGGALGYLYARLTPAEIVDMPRTPAVNAAILTHEGVSDEARGGALRALGGADEVAILLDAMERSRASTRGAARPVTLALGRLLVAEPRTRLRAAGERLQDLALRGPDPEARRVGFAAWATAEGSGVRGFAAAARTPERLSDFLEAIALVPDARVRASVFTKVAPLVSARAPAGSLPAAIHALGAIPGHDREKLDALIAIAREDSARALALEAIRGVDRAHFRAADARTLLGVLVAHVSGLGSRSSESAIGAVRLGLDLAGLLPLGEGDRARAELVRFEPQVVVIRPIPHQMLFDRRKFTVEAGRVVEISFENTDIMPHNLVITAPGALAEVGRMADEMGAEGQARDFIPATKKILWATKLLLPGQSQRLQLTAPKTPGAYPFLCTFPGHWLVMNGVMEVVEKVVGAPAPVADVEPAAGPAAPARPFVRMWTVGDLEGDAARLGRGRSFARGREIFSVAGCIKCHSLNGEGAKLGPDLTKIAERYRGVELLRQVLDPSAAINDQFRAYVVTLKSGDPVAGIVLKEDARRLYLASNLLDPSDVMVLDKDRIVAKQASAISSMPTGLLVTLARDEILDLLAYVESGGNAGHPYFQRP